MLRYCLRCAALVVVCRCICAAILLALPCPVLSGPVVRPLCDALHRPTLCCAVLRPAQRCAELGFAALCILALLLVLRNIMPGFNLRCATTCAALCCTTLTAASPLVLNCAVLGMAVLPCDVQCAPLHRACTCAARSCPALVLVLHCTVLATLPAQRCAAPVPVLRRGALLCPTNTRALVLPALRHSTLCCYMRCAVLCYAVLLPALHCAALCCIAICIALHCAAPRLALYNFAKLLCPAKLQCAVLHYYLR